MNAKNHRGRVRPRKRTTFVALAGVAVASSAALLAATPASAATTTHDVTFTPDYSSMVGVAADGTPDLSKVTGASADGGVLTVTYKPSFSGDAPDLSGCGVTEVKPIVMKYAISDQRPTNAYVGTPDLTYSELAVRWNNRGGAFLELFTTRGKTALAANTGWEPLTAGATDSETRAALFPYLNPTVADEGGVLTTAPFVPNPQPGTNFVPTQRFTVTAGDAPALQPGITGYPISWHTEMNYYMLAGGGRLDGFGFAGSFDGKAGSQSTDHGPGEVSSVDFYWADSSNRLVNYPGSISARVVLDRFSTTISCDSGAGPVVDHVIGAGAGSAALAAGAAATAVAFVRRRRAQRS